MAAKKIPKAFYFIALNFLFADGVSTLTTVIILISQMELKYSVLVQAIALVLAPLAKFLGNTLFHYLEKWFNIRSKSILVFLLLGYVGVTSYGILGLTPLPFGLRQYNILPTSSCTPYTQNKILSADGYLNCLYIPYEFFGFVIISNMLAGSIQTVSRTIFSQLVPNGLGYIFFGLLDLSGKGSVFVGPLIVGALNDRLGSVRFGFIYLLLVFLIPIPFLIRLNVFRGKAEAERYSQRLDEKIIFKTAMVMDGREDDGSPMTPIKKKEIHFATVVDTEDVQIEKTAKMNSPFDLDTMGSPDQY